jgi:hypothetical protein
MSLVAVILASFLLPIGALESGKQQSGAGLWAQTAAGFGVRLTKPINSSDQERRDLITFMRGR